MEDTTMHTAIKLMIGEPREPSGSDCTLTATAVPKGPSFTLLESQLVSTLGIHPSPFSITVILHCTSAAQATEVSGKLTEGYRVKKGTLPLFQWIEAKGTETVFRATGEQVEIVTQMQNTEELTAMFGLAESMLSEVFTQQSSIKVAFNACKDLRQREPGEAVMLYSLLEGSKFDVDLDLWTDLFTYIRTQTKELSLPTELTKVLAMASIYSRGSVKLKLRGVQAIPTELRSKIEAYSASFNSFREAITKGEEPAMTEIITSLTSCCLPRVDAVVYTSLFCVSLSLVVPGLSNLFTLPA